MKKISLVLLIFLLSLCLIPPTSAVYGDESPDSITSFSETLPDDVLFYPDSFDNGTIELADYGEISDESSSPDYILTHVKDGSAFNETTATDIEIWFEVDTTGGIEGFSYAHYMDVDSGTDCDLTAYDFDQDLFVKIDEPLPSSYGWMNGTILDSDYWNTTHIAFSMFELSGTADLYWDYGEITLHKMTLIDSDHYAESFADVSDWTQQTGDEWGTDNDVVYFGVAKDAAYDLYYSNTPAITDGLNYYYEVRVKNNISDSYKTNLIVRWWSGDGATGDFGNTGNLGTSDSWQTFKGIIPSDQGIECIQFMFYVAADASGPNRFYVDYLRITPADEMGWQHDGSTTEGVSITAGTISSDGDVLSVDAGQDVDILQIEFDTTVTSSSGDYGYYPFIEWSILSVTDGDTDDRVWLARAYDSDNDWVNLPPTVGGYVAETGVFRVNLAATVLDDFSYFKIYFDDTLDALDLDYVKLYSIANFTVQNYDTATNDYLYVEDNILQASIASTTFDKTWEGLRIDYDPTLAVSTVTYTVWNMTSSDFDSVLWNHKIGGWQGYSTAGETRGSFVLGTLTDFEMLFWTTSELSAIKFIDTRAWQDVGEAVFIFPIGWDPTFQFGFDAFFIFAGLIMIPLSTMYLIRGGREEASMDKLFYGLIIFAVGFGLLVGGIMP